MTSSSQFALIREKFEKKSCYLDDILGNLFMDCFGVYLDESAPYPDIVEIIERLESNAPEKELVLTPKLKATSQGDWDSRVIMLHSGYFESRERFDEILISTKEMTMLKWMAKKRSLTRRS